MQYCISVNDMTHFHLKLLHFSIIQNQIIETIQNITEMQWTNLINIVSSNLINLDLLSVVMFVNVVYILFLLFQKHL